MAAQAPASSHANKALSQDLQAAALWMYVHTKVPRFTSDVARAVIQSLAIEPGEDERRLAKRLRRALHERGVAIKHSAALQAAAQLQGERSWYTATAAPAPTLRLIPMSTAANEEFASWRELAPRLCACCDDYLGQDPARHIHLRFGPRHVLVSALVPSDHTPGSMESMPLFAVNPTNDDEHWLQDAPAAFERLRRHLEERGVAVLDGVAVLQLCNRYSKEALERLPAIPALVRPTDACNSELVLLREDNPLTPSSRFEIARGDEMTCWTQLELATKDEADKHITLEDAGWLIGEGRYVWELATVHPRAFAPVLTTTMLNERDSEKLLRRYKLAKRIFSDKLEQRDVTKRLQFLDGPAETCRVDLHQMLLVMQRAGLTWESFCEAEGLKEDMKPEMPLGVVIKLAERLNLERPNQLFAAPPRAELVRADDDAVLRALFPRVHFVRYRVAPRVRREIKSAVVAAIGEFAESIRMRTFFQAGQFASPDDPIPYLTYASDGEELRLALEEHGLVAYIGVLPHLIPTEGMVKTTPGMSPYAFGHALFLDIDLAEGVLR